MHIIIIIFKPAFAIYSLSVNCIAISLTHRQTWQIRLIIIIIKSLFILDEVKAMLVKMSRIHTSFIRHAYTSNKTNKKVAIVLFDYRIYFSSALIAVFQNYFSSALIAVFQNEKHILPRVYKFIYS